MKTTWHCSLEIEPFLKQRRNLDGMFAVDGQTLSSREARQMLKRWPYPYFCGCSNVGEDGRCLGHEKDEGGSIDEMV